MYNLIILIKKIAWRILHVLSVISDNFHGASYDKFYGVDFLKIMENEETAVSKENGNRYQATHVRAIKYLKRYLKRYPPSPGAGGVLDVGCGKGKMLDFFSHYSFSIVDGLEYSQILAEIAENNMKKLNLSCRIFVGDAAEFDELDSYDYFYLFNPFPREIMLKFVNNLSISLKRKPRYITVFYLNPLYKSIFLENNYTIKNTFCRDFVIFKKNCSGIAR